MLILQRIERDRVPLILVQEMTSTAGSISTFTGGGFTSAGTLHAYRPVEIGSLGQFLAQAVTRIATGHRNRETKQQRQVQLPRFAGFAGSD